MSSKLVKSFQVVEKEERKLVMVAHRMPSLSLDKDEEENSQNVAEHLLSDTMLEIQQRKEQAEQELQAWRQAEEEKIRISLEDMQKQAYENGYATGLEKGQEEWKERIEKAVLTLEKAYEEKEKIIQEAEPFVINLTMEIAKKIIQQELKQNKESLLHMMKQILHTINNASAISIGVAPDDFAFVQKQRDQLLAVMDGQMEVKIFPDYTAKQGGCRILTPYGSIDARIDVQLSEIKKVLLSCNQVKDDE